MNAKQITIPCLDYAIAADWYEGGNPAEVLLTIVGYGRTKADNAQFVGDILQRTGANGLVLDLSGHGESPFKLDDTKPAQHLLEVTAAFDWLRSTYPKAKISVMGTSYGGYMAAWLTRFRNFEKLVLRTPALYKPEDFYSPHCLIHKSDEVVAYRKNMELIAHNALFLQEPVFDGKTLLIVHGSDEQIPIETSTMYQENFAPETYLAQDFMHSFRNPRNPQDRLEPYKIVIADWLQPNNKGDHA